MTNETEEQEIEYTDFFCNWCFEDPCESLKEQFDDEEWTKYLKQGATDSKDSSKEDYLFVSSDLIEEKFDYFLKIKYTDENNHDWQRIVDFLQHCAWHVDGYHFPKYENTK